MVIYWPDDSFYKIISEMLCFHSTRLIPAQVPLDLYHLLCRMHAPDHSSGSFSKHPTYRAPFPPELWMGIRVGHGVLIDRHCPPPERSSGPLHPSGCSRCLGSTQAQPAVSLPRGRFSPQRQLVAVGAKDGDENHPGAFQHSPKMLLRRS